MNKYARFWETYGLAAAAACEDFSFAGHKFERLTKKRKGYKDFTFIHNGRVFTIEAINEIAANAKWGKISKKLNRGQA